MIKQPDGPDWLAVAFGDLGSVVVRVVVFPELLERIRDISLEDVIEAMFTGIEFAVQLRHHSQIAGT